VRLRQHENPDWWADRLGKVSASRMADLMARTKSGYGAGRKNYLTELALQRLTGERQETYTTAAMEWGIETEPQARLAFEFDTDMEVEADIDFILHPRIREAGASPDGLIGDNQVLEIKCPNSATHLDFLRTGQIPRKYVLQMQWQLACTDRVMNYYASFDPRFPEPMELRWLEVPRDDKLISEMEAEVEEFLWELRETIDELKERYGV
jgi:putative phage-type endonuclease